VKFSTMIAAKNEERHLPGALESVAGCYDIVVVDDDSTDRTAEIAQAAGARVLRRKLDGFASQKNFGIEQCHHDWVLILDADERVTPELLAAIRALEPPREAAAYKFAWRNYLGKKWLAHGGLYPDYHTRLIDRRRAHYGQREVHELLEIDGETRALRGDIIHLTYADTRAYLAKVRKYARLEAKWTRQRPTLRSVIKEFLVRYFKQEGYKDGWAGLVSAKLRAYYRWIVWRSVR
jgi:glycosyltransferase involved in cell wall biosynthesis